MFEPRYLECFVLGSVDGQQVNEFGHEHPLNSQVVGKLLGHCPVAVILPDDMNGSLPFNDSVPGLNNGHQFLLEQPSDDHCRSFQIFGENIPTDFLDEFGNKYYAVNLKGNNFRNPYVFESTTSVEGYLSYGLQESAATARVLRASHVLASRGISTEFVFGLAEPKRLPWPVLAPGIDASILVTRGVFRQKLIEDYMAEVPDDMVGSEQVKKIIKTISTMGFYITARATDSPYRLSDMFLEFQRKKVFDFINTNLLGPDHAPLDPYSADDLKYYVLEFVAPKAGDNLGLMHPDLAHGYLNRLNITALAGIVDLDSVHGEGLDMGDKPVTDEQLGKDLVMVLNSISDIYYRKFEETFSISQPDYKPHKLFLEHYFDKIRVRLGSDETYLGYKASMLAEIEGRVGSIGVSLHDWALGEVVADLSQEVAVDSLKYLGLGKKQSARSVLGEIRNLSTDDFGAVLTEIYSGFVTDFERFVPTCIEEFLRYAVNADQKGETINPFAAFINSDERNTSETWMAMQADIQTLFEAAMASRLVDNELMKAILPSELIRGPIIRYLLHELGETAAARAPGRNVLEGILKHYSTEFEAAMQYEVPETHFPNGDSYLDIFGRGESIKRYWRSTEGVSVEDALVFIGQGGGSISLEELTFVSGSRMIAVTPSREDAIIEEIVFDVAGDGNIMSDHSDEIQVCFDNLPSYVLVIERLQDGSLNYRMFEEPENLVTVVARVIEEEVDVPNSDRQFTFDDLAKEAPNITSP